MKDEPTLSDIEQYLKERGGEMHLSVRNNEYCVEIRSLSGHSSVFMRGDNLLTAYVRAQELHEGEHGKQ